MGLLQVQEYRPKTYWETQQAATMIAKMLGIPCDPKTRLDPFKLVVLLDRDERYADRPETPVLRSLLAQMVHLRCRGLEMKHKNGRYI